MDRPISGNGLTVYLVEELSDARLRCEQLKRYIREALEAVDKSPHKDVVFEVAGHLIRGIPEALFRLDKALSATAMAMAKMDYDMLKQSLRPEKADELDNVLEDARLRFLRKQSTMLPETAAKSLEKIASTIEDSGHLPIGDIGSLIAGLGKTSGIAVSLRDLDLTVETPISAFALRKIASTLAEKKPSRNELIAALEAIALQGLGKHSTQILETASSREEVMKGFKESNPSLSQKQLEEIADHWERNKDVVKDKQAAYPFEPVSQDVEARFEEDKSADPTENMTEEGKKKWDKYHGQVHKLAWKVREASDKDDSWKVL